MANDFLEALAVMLVTSCIIPILVLLSFVWLAKTLLSIQIQIPLPGQAERQSDRRTASRVEDQNAAVTSHPFHRVYPTPKKAGRHKKNLCRRPFFLVRL